MHKVSKALNEYILFKNTFSTQIASNKFLEKVIRRISSYGMFNGVVTRFYNKKHEEILKYLKFEFSNFLENYTYDDNQTLNEREEKIIFSLWMQGIENAPEVVQETVKSQKKYADTYGYKYVLLDESNLYNYVEIPQIILDKYNNGIIDPIKYSDIIRTLLLSKYSGVWLDATIYIDNSKKLEYLENEFYTIRARGDENFPKYVANGRWALFCLAGSKNNIVFDFLKRFQIEYFIKYDIAIDYFLIDYIMELGYRNNRDIKKHIDNVIENNQELYFLANNFTNKYSANQWENILLNTSIFKCSYKVPFKEGERTYYDALKEDKL